MTSPIVSAYGLGPSVFAITDDAQFEGVYHDCFGRDEPSDSDCDHLVIDPSCGFCRARARQRQVACVECGVGGDDTLCEACFHSPHVLAYRSTPEFILDVYEMKWF